jgi:hypothetical protein
LLLALFLPACNPKTESFFAPAELPSGSISGRVTLRGVTPLTGMTLSLLATTTTTGANGMYSFHDLAPRTYVVLLAVPAGLICVPDSKEGEVRDGETTIIDFECTQSDFLINTQFDFVHVAAGLSFVCVIGAVSEASLFANASGVLPALTGATWTVSWAGPGVVGSAQRNGTLDANNKMLDRQQINRFGTYTATLTVTANGLTKQATGAVTVGAPQGTCPPP